MSDPKSGSEPSTPVLQSHEDLEDVRRKKGVIWQELGHSAYGNDTGPLTTIQTIANTHADHKAEVLEAEHATTIYRVAGRVMLSRIQGKLRFMQLRDGTGEIQLFISKAEVGDSAWSVLDAIDLGDIMLVEGPPMRTRTGQLSIRTKMVRPLTKALRAPAKFTGVEDVEIRYRQRYVDLIENHAEVADVFRARTVIIAAIREFLDARDFLEVETPVLQLVRGGATARPFRTHHNALELDLFLRIAPELYLKRLVVGGFDRVYEIARTFRNEGISTRHNPEFTLLEFYQAYATYEDLILVTEELLEHVDARVCARFPKFAEGRPFQLVRPFARVRMVDALKHSLAKRNVSVLAQWSLLGGSGDWKSFQQFVATADVSHEDKVYLRKCRAPGEMLFAAYEVFAEKHLSEDYRSADGAQSVPVFITDYPFDVSPLARKKDVGLQREQYGEVEVEFTDRFELFIDGREVCNAFSELNDPDEQAARFRGQLENRAHGDEEAMDFDADYVRALAHGMPPTAGFGLGVDRLVMALTSMKSIRDVILFPLLRPEAPGKNERA